MASTSPHRSRGCRAIEGQRPTAADLLGATLAVAEDIVIVAEAPHRAGALLP